MLSTIVETSMRALFSALFLLLPLSLLLASSIPVHVSEASVVTSERTTVATYTSTAFDTTVFSSSGYMMVQKPLNIAPQGVGFMAPNGECSQDTIPLTVESGTSLSLDLTSANPANLYLLPSATYQTSSNGCNLIGGSIVAANNFTDYTLNWTANEDGIVYLLLTGPNTIIILRDIGSTESVQEFATVTYTRTETGLVLQSSTITANYTTTAVKSETSTVLPRALIDLSFVALTITLLATAPLSDPGTKLLRAIFPTVHKKARKLTVH